VTRARELGYDEADRVVRSLVSAVDRHGFREHYDPLNGRGLAARSFGFATLLVALLAQCGTEAGEPSGIAAMIRP
jgi:hypothetical protein